jgi:hypothetical protein
MTYALLSTMMNETNTLDKDNNLQVQDWFRETEKSVSKLIENQSAQIFTPLNFSIAKVDDEVRSSIKLFEIPSIVVSNVFNREIDDDNLELKPKLRAKLSELSSRGTSSKIILQKEETANSIIISVGYEISDKKIEAKVNLKKQKNIIHQFQVSGQTDDLTSLVENITQQILNYFKK